MRIYAIVVTLGLTLIVVTTVVLYTHKGARPPVQAQRLLRNLVTTVASLECRPNQFEFRVNESAPQSIRRLYCTLFRSDGTESDLSYELKVDEATHASLDSRLDQGDEMVLSITNALLDEVNNIISLSSISRVAILDAPMRKYQLRKLTSSFGAPTMLGVLINVGGVVPIYSEDMLYKLFFQDTVSLKYQYMHCSAGKFVIQPSRLGVITVSVPGVSLTDLPQTVINAASTAVLQHLASVGQGTFSTIKEYSDMVAFITPSMNGWLAYSAVGGVTSVYNNRWGGYIASLMHETGHNLGLLHAHENDQEYLDYTGYMGGSIIGYHDAMNFPQMCYNAANLYQLGWYADRIINLNMRLPTLVRLAAFVDYSKTQAGVHYVVARSQNVYLHYNRAKDFNADTYEYKDHLTIYQTKIDGSYLFAAINSWDNPLYERSFPGIGTWRAQICKSVTGSSTTPDYLVISVGFGDSICSLASSW